MEKSWHTAGRCVEQNPLSRVLRLARRLFVLNLILAVPVYLYVMYEFKVAGMW
jgi:hypothetical protein